MQHPAKVYNRNVARVRISLSPHYLLVAYQGKPLTFNQKRIGASPIGETEKENVL